MVTRPSRSWSNRADRPWVEVVRDLRREAHGQQVSVMVIGRAPMTAEALAAAFAAGADDVVTGASAEALLDRVRVCLRHSARLDAALRDSEWRFRELAENIEEVFYNYDAVNDRLLYINAAFEQIWGHPIDKIYEKPVSYLDAVHPEDRPVAEDSFRRHLAGEETTVSPRRTTWTGSAVSA